MDGEKIRKYIQEHLSEIKIESVGITDDTARGGKNIFVSYRYKKAEAENVFYLSQQELERLDIDIFAWQVARQIVENEVIRYDL